MNNFDMVLNNLQVWYATKKKSSQTKSNQTKQNFKLLKLRKKM